MAEKIPYLTREERSNGYVWVFRPPKAAREAGVAKSEIFHDLRVARRVVRESLKAIRDWKAGRISGRVLTRTSTLSQLSASYLETKHFDSLSLNTKKTYRASFKAICSTRLGGSRKLGDVRLQDITPGVCEKAYEQWLTESTAKANANRRLFSVLYSYAQTLEVALRNPMASVKSVKHTPRSITWSSDQVTKFLDVAFSSYKYRGVGLIVMMAYEWCQRPVDIRHLKWSDLDLEKRTVNITQRKRGAKVELPISDKLHSLLLQQKEDFDFQEYVVPVLRKGDQAWRPITGSNLRSMTTAILQEAELPTELAVGYLRKTGIVELVEADVSTAAIMSVTGHKNIQSLNPYLKPNLETAKSALAKRGTL
jgi:integrase